MNEDNFIPEEKPSALTGRLTPQAILRAVVEKLWLVLACLLIGISASVYLAYKAPKLYRTSGLLELDIRQAKYLPAENFLTHASQPGPQLAMTMQVKREFMQQDAIYGLLMQRMNLESDPRILPPGGDRSTHILQVISKLKSITRVSPKEGTPLFSLSVTHEDPAFAAELCNTWMAVITEKDRELMTDVSTEGLEKLGTKEEDLKQEMERLQERVREHNQKTTVLKEDLETYKSRISQLESTKGKLLGEIAAIDNDLADIDQAGTNVSRLVLIPTIQSSVEFQENRAKIDALELEFSRIKRKYKQQHHRYIGAQAELALMYEKLLESRDSAVRYAQDRKSRLESGVEDVNEGIANLAEAVRETNEKMLPFIQETRELEYVTSEFNRIRSRRSLVSLDKEINPPSGILTPWQEAKQPFVPFSPNVPKFIIAGIMAGLAAGLALAIGVDLLDSSFRTVGEVEETLGREIVGSIGALTGRQPEKAQLLVGTDRATPEITEQFRTIRASVTLLQEGHNIMMFTSALPSEGKTFCSINYAASLAQQGLKTVVVDCDLRKPAVEEAITGGRGKHRGVSDYLIAVPETQLNGNRRADTATSVSPSSRSVYSMDPLESFSITDLNKKHSAGNRAAEPAPIRGLDATSQNDIESAEKGHAEPEQLKVKATRKEKLHITDYTVESGTPNLHFIPAGKAAKNPAELLAQNGFSQMLRELVAHYDRIVVDTCPLLGISDSLLLAKQVDAVALVVRTRKTPRKAAMRALELLDKSGAPLAGLIVNGVKKTIGTGDYDSNYGYYYYGYGESEDDEQQSAARS